VYTASAICGVQTEHSGLKPYRNPSHHTGLLYVLVTSLLIRRIQIEEMSRLGWLVGFVKHIVFPIPAVTFNFQNPSFIPTSPVTVFIGMLG
jgi:hypothetical protein